ncbi:MAG TPA: T9SS type A sorting domain-containing protein, partial [Fibrobacteria bacterium]|nr:T9SS type A sorting domain-containing protein [Fibrobacteria bacterium]
MQTGILASARILLFAVAAACITPSRADVTLTLVDGQGKTLPGIACATEGSTAVSDAQGKLTLRAALSTMLQEGPSGGEASLTRIPLAPGEKATVVVSDARGRLVLNRRFAMGERIEVPGQNRGVFFVRVHSRGFRAQGRMTSLAGTLAFEGVAIRTSSRALARASAAAANEVVAT